MAWISYKVFMDGVIRLAEESPIPYEVYASLTFSTTSLYAVWSALKANIASQGWRMKAFIFWFIISTIYVLGFPILMGATAGYLTPSTAGFSMADGTFLQPDSLDLRSCYNVFAGALIGHSNGTIAEGPPVSVFDAVASARAIGFYYFDELGYPGEPNDCSACAQVVDNSSFRQDYPLFTSLLNGEFAAAFSLVRIKLILALPGTMTGDDRQYVCLDNSDPCSSDPEYISSIVIEGRQYSFRNYDFAELQSYNATYCYNHKIIPSLENLAECLQESYFIWGFSSLMVYINLTLFMPGLLACTLSG